MPNVDPTAEAAPAPARAAPPRAGAFALLVAAGIFLSRVFGLIRQRVFAHYLGNTLYADAWNAALRIPNILQNLLGEGTLSASFIPVYAKLLHEGREEDAGRVAAATFALLLAVAGGLSVLGVMFAPLMVEVIAPGFEGERLRLATQATRLIFPMTGILVLSAWALGILNSHRRFFLSYVAPVIWNVAMIAAALFFGRRGVGLGDLVIAIAWGALVGGVLQLLVQLPRVLRLEPNLRLAWRDLRSPFLATVVANALPVLLARGVVQISAYVDVMLASQLSRGAVSALSYAMQLYILPVSLFGMSVAAAELPELARQRGSAPEVMRARVSAGLRQIAVMAVPSAVAFAALGDVAVGALYQTGRFGRGDTLFVYLVLLGYTLGLMASTGTRLFSSTFFALGDTRTPAWIAFARVVLAAGLGYALMWPFERHLSIGGQPLGAVGLAIGSGVAAWVEWALLRRVLRMRIGAVGAGVGPVARMIGAALLAALVGRAILLVLPEMRPWMAGVLVLGIYGVLYFVLARLFGVAEAGALVDRVVRRLRR